MIALTSLIVLVIVLDMVGFDVTGHLEEVERERGVWSAIAEAMEIMTL